MVKLRDYQRRLKAECYEGLRRVQSVMAQLPTGGGKTVVFLDIAADGVQNEKSVLIVVDRIELIKQTAEKALSMYGIHAEVIQGQKQRRRSGSTLFSGGNGRLIIASQQTINNRSLPYADLLIFDEAHLCLAETYTNTINHYLKQGAKVLGFTATPWSAKGEGFNNLFHELVCGPTVSEMIENGYLNDYDLVFRKLEEPLKAVKLRAGEFNEKQLFNLYDKPKVYGDIYETWLGNASDRKTLVFCINVEHSQKTAEYFKQNGVVAMHLDGASPKDERERVMSLFRAGHVQVLTNCNLFSYGLDVPDCDCVVLARATNSLVYFLQACGRGLRTSPGKQETLIIDHGDNIIRHGLPDDPRFWTLEPRKKKRATRNDDEVLHIIDEEIKAEVKRMFRHEGADFLRLTREERESLRELIRKGQKRPKMYGPQDLPNPKSSSLGEMLNAAEELPVLTKAGKVNYLAALAVYRSCNKLTLGDLENVQQRAGYKQGWVVRMSEYWGVVQ